MPQPPPRGHPPRLSTLVRVMPYVISMGIVAFLVSCGIDDPVSPPGVPPDALTEAAAGKKGDEPTLDPATLSIHDMLADPLLQALVLGIDVQTLSEPLLAAVDALAKGQTSKATNLIGKASAEADALEDDPTAAVALIYWSAIELYFEEAELIQGSSIRALSSA